MYQIPLAVASGPVPIPLGGVDLSLTWVTLTPGSARLGFRATRQDNDRMAGSGRLGHREFLGHQLR
jgi:hypothetical protein